MAQKPEIIVYGYQMAPNPQKLFQILALFKLPYKYVEIPRIMPRPMLADIGVTYRRTPLMSIDSDMYIDNALIVERLSDIAQQSDCDLEDATNHLEFDGLGQQLFSTAVGLLPADSPAMIDPAFLADRSELTGRPFDPKIWPKIRPAMVSKMITLVRLIEKHHLQDGKRFVLGGSTPSTADIHLYWALNWPIRVHKGAQPELSEATYPKLWAWMSNVENFIKDRKLETKIEMAEAKRILQTPPKHEYAKFVPHVEDNQEKLSPGQKIKVTPADTGRTGPQLGELISLNYEQVCLRNEKGLVMHFPRLGYEIVAA